MKAWVWVIVASVGFGVMLMAYGWLERTDYTGPWASGLIVMSREAPAQRYEATEVILMNR